MLKFQTDKNVGSTATPHTPASYFQYPSIFCHIFFICSSLSPCLQYFKANTTYHIFSLLTTSVTSKKWKRYITSKLLSQIKKLIIICYNRFPAHIQIIHYFSLFVQISVKTNPFTVFVGFFKLLLSLFESRIVSSKIFIPLTWRNW